MKKVTVLIAAIFCCLPVLSQEAESSGNVPQVSAVARLDARPVVPLGASDGWQFDAEDFFSNTSLYTLIDGNIGDWFSYSVANHWLSTDPRSLYVTDFEDNSVGANLFRSGYTNWLDWANLTFSTSGDWGGFDFTVGKDVTLVGSIETDQYDFDSYYDLTSYFWNEYNVYQWGATARYTLPSETSSFAFQWQTSPFGERSFGSKLFNYSLQWRGEWDWLTTIWSTNLIQYDQKKYMSMIALGQEFYAGDFTFRLDWQNRAFPGNGKYFGQEWQLQGGVIYNFNDKVDVALLGGYSSLGGDYDYLYCLPRLEKETYWNAGARVQWYPLRDSQDLRVHGVVAYNNYYCEDGLSINLGVTYNLNLTNLFQK